MRVSGVEPCESWSEDVLHGSPKAFTMNITLSTGVDAEFT